MSALTHQFSFKLCDTVFIERSANRASIVALFFSGCPSNVFRKVPFVIIYSIKSEAGAWTLSNICQKFSKIVPAFTDFNASTAIILVAYGVWIIAARAHTTPDVIKEMVVSFFSIAVPVGVFQTTLLLAPTRFGVAISKYFTGDVVCASAIAFTEPEGLTISVLTDQSNRDQSTKSFACDINSFGHRAAPTVRRSSGEAGVVSTGLAAHYAIAKG